MRRQNSRDECRRIDGGRYGGVCHGSGGWAGIRESDRRSGAERHAERVLGLVVAQSGRQGVPHPFSGGKAQLGGDFVGEHCQQRHDEHAGNQQCGTQFHKTVPGGGEATWSGFRHAQPSLAWGRLDATGGGGR